MTFYFFYDYADRKKMCSTNDTVSYVKNCTQIEKYHVIFMLVSKHSIGSGQREKNMTPHSYLHEIFRVLGTSQPCKF